MEKMDGMSMDLTKNNILKLKEIFPNVFTEGKIDFSLLEMLLGEDVDTSKEKYQFVWNGKSNAIKVAQSPSTSTLRPNKEKSLNWNDTDNLFIEGDNLEVLKQLQKTYFGRIKMIYIDPPYNTGKDFVYKDDFKNPVESYVEQTNQKTKSNPDTSGRYHSDWLNMIYPRLILARNLLREDGLIFISINDVEHANLKKICDEIYGENNFVADMVWTNKEGGGGSDTKLIKVKHEYIICYAKDASCATINGVKVEDEARYTNEDKWVATRGKYQLVKLDSASLGYIASLDYPITAPDGSEIYPNKNGEKISRWRWGKDKLQWGRDNDYLEFKKGKDGNWNVYSKQYLNADTEGNIVERTNRPFAVIDKYSSTQASKQLQKILNGKYFDYSKPKDLMRYLVEIATSKNDIVLDFFAGSATTAHAVMELNSEDQGERVFIAVQLPELIDEGSDAYGAGYRTICDIGEDRIKKAAKIILDEIKQKAEREGLFAKASDIITDLGYKVFFLDSTNINPWDNRNEYSEESLFNTATVFKLDRTKEDVLYEIMLKYGVFDQPVCKVDVNGKSMYRVGQRHMIVCLEDKIDDIDISAIAKLEPRVVVFKEDGFQDDNDKINAEYNLKKSGVEDVKCI